MLYAFFWVITQKKAYNFINCIFSWHLNHTEWDGHVVRTHKVHTASLKAWRSDNKYESVAQMGQ